MLNDEQVLAIVAPVLDDQEDALDELDAELEEAGAEEALAEMEFREQVELFFEEQLPRRCRRVRRRALRERRNSG
jgi:hypothetical protein